MVRIQGRRQRIGCRLGGLVVVSIELLLLLKPSTRGSDGNMSFAMSFGLGQYRRPIPGGRGPGTGWVVPRCCCCWWLCGCGGGWLAPVVVPLGGGIHRRRHHCPGRRSVLKRVARSKAAVMVMRGCIPSWMSVMRRRTTRIHVPTKSITIQQTLFWTRRMTARKGIYLERSTCCDDQTRVGTTDPPAATIRERQEKAHKTSLQNHWVPLRGTKSMPVRVASRVELLKSDRKAIRKRVEHPCPNSHVLSIFPFFQLRKQKGHKK